ncbi:hypothetical protein L2E82_25472 [Cichorium intybus]|uniref:Uncharacterized protein n=1 Tax=Cichorium intybus TaxID=13427 RepID=A0ACB9E3K4_CICIN|nr:hypothetical protein L2E82_25472 [Cichorium intybus]
MPAVVDRLQEHRNLLQKKFGDRERGSGGRNLLQKEEFGCSISEWGKEDLETGKRLTDPTFVKQGTQVVDWYSSR